MPGQIVALVGESGCGKSTLARALLGLQPLAAGEVLVDGEPLTRSRSGLKAYRRRAQLVLQDPMGSLNPRMTVYESVAEGLRVHGVDREEERVADALSRVGMRPPERFFARYPHELSGGQRQRVVIAGALVLEPEILVADEPVSSLDASVRGEILALLLRLRDELGLSILIVTHDLGLAWNIADRIAVMYLGRIIEEGTTEEVLSEPEAPVHAGAAVGRARDRPPGPDRPGRRAPGSRAHPRRLPVPPPLPRAAGGAPGRGRGAVPWRVAAPAPGPGRARRSLLRAGLRGRGRPVGCQRLCVPTCSAWAATAPGHPVHGLGEHLLRAGEVHPGVPEAAAPERPARGAGQPGRGASRISAGSGPRPTPRRSSHAR